MKYTGKKGQLVVKESGYSISTPLDQNMKLRVDDGEALENATMCRQMVGSLIYLTITHPNLTFAMGLASELLEVPRKPHLNEVQQELCYISGTLYFYLFYVANADL